MAGKKHTVKNVFLYKMLLKYLRMLAKENNIEDFERYRSKVELEMALRDNGVEISKSDSFEYMSIKDLYALAKEKRVKYYLKKNKGELAEALAIDCSGVDFDSLEATNRNSTMIVLKDEDTGEVLRFKSIGYASKELNINTGSIFYRLKNNKPLHIGDGFFFSYGR